MLSNERLPDKIRARINVTAEGEDFKILHGDYNLTFDISALTADRQIVFSNANSKTLSFNSTSISCELLPTAANSTFLGRLAGSDVTTGTSNTIIGYSATAGDPEGTVRFVLNGAGLYNSSTHFETTNVDIPNLESASYANLVKFDPGTGQLSYDAVPVLGGDWADGTVGTPARKFYLDQNTGIYRVGADTIGFSAGGVLSTQLGASQALFLDGTASAPGIAFLTDSNTGIYRVGADQIGLSCGGVLKLSIAIESAFTTNDVVKSTVNLINTTSTRTYSFESGGSSGGSLSSLTEVGIDTFGIRVTGTSLDRFIHKWNENQSLVYSGTEALPSHSFFEDNDTGMYRSATDTLSWTTAGTLRMSLNTTSLTNTLPFYLPDGSVGAPSYAFASDTNLGMFRTGANQLAFSVGLAAYPLEVSNNGINCIRNTDAGNYNTIVNLQVDGNGFDDIELYKVFYGYAETSSTTGYNLARYDNFAGAAWRVRGDGATFADGAYSGAGADYAEWFESSDGKEIPVGSSVVLLDGKVAVAQPGDEAKIVGVIRPKTDTNEYVAVGNSAEDYWAGKFLTDEYGSFIYESVDYYKWIDPNGEHKGYYANQIPPGVVVPENKEVVPNCPMKKLNPAYDPNQAYTPRSARPEWHIVGMLGQIPVKNGQVLGNRWQLIRNINDGSVAKMYLVKK